MLLKNDRDLGVKNGSLRTDDDVNKDSMCVVLDGIANCRLEYYAAVNVTIIH